MNLSRSCSNIATHSSALSKSSTLKLFPQIVDRSTLTVFSGTYRGEQAIKDLEAADAWEKKHKRERAEFERLKAKFGAAQ